MNGTFITLQKTSQDIIVTETLSNKLTNYLFTV